MEKERGEEELSIMEAVDQLSNMAEIDLNARIQEEPVSDEFSDKINWRDPHQVLQNTVLIKESFRILHRYLQNMVRQDRSILEDPQVQKGIQAIMLIASEAVQKIDRFTAHPISKYKEYLDLKKYYKQQILHQMPESKEQSEDWEADLEQLEGIEIHRRGLRDLETVRKDEDYELFFIKGEDGRPFFSRALLRHIRLIGNFDEFIAKAEGADPFLHIRELLDRALHIGAKEALKIAAPHIDAFYKQGMKEKSRPYIGSLNKSVMALRMAANPKNLIENKSFKSCLEYYADFHRFLRDAMTAPGYLQRISGERTDDFSRKLLTMTHVLCGTFFLRIEHRVEGIKLIREMINTGKKMQVLSPKKRAEKEELQFWVDLADSDASIRYLLKHYPNGPIMRALDVFREEEESQGYDPLMHHNLPAEQFAFSNDRMHVSVLRMPCPTIQEVILKANVVDEFAGFLRYYKHELKPDKHLIVNLQDVTSWKEFARCKALNDFASRAEFHNQVFVLGLAKDSDFYQQIAEYQSISGTSIFLEQFEEQLLGGDSCGFFFPKAIKREDVKKWVKMILQGTYRTLFDKQTTLSRKERLFFIDFCYLLLVIKVIEKLEINSMSFTCKDALDKGPSETAMFYGFLHLIQNINMDEDVLLWILYAPVLFSRERAILAPHFKRVLFFLEELHQKCLTKQKGIFDLCTQLNKNFIKFKIFTR